MYEINNDLYQYATSDIPSGYSNLEKAIFIYVKLCQKLSYSMDYLMNDYFESYSSAQLWYTNPHNISIIDGTTRNDVVCFTFNAIYSQTLQKAKLISENDNYDMLLDNGLFNSHHDALYFTIDGIRVSADATKGIYTDNDLIIAKSQNKDLMGWHISPSPFVRKSKENITLEEKKLSDALAHVQHDTFLLGNEVNAYVNLKKLDNTFITQPLEKRIKTFLDLCTLGPDYQVQSFNYLYKLKHALFTHDEVYSRARQQDSMNVELEFYVNKKLNELQAFLFYNPQGYLNVQGKENFDKLSIYEISLKSKNIKSISINEFNNSNNYRSTFAPTGMKYDYPQILSEGAKPKDNNYPPLNFSGDNIRGK